MHSRQFKNIKEIHNRQNETSKMEKIISYQTVERSIMNKKTVNKSRFIALIREVHDQQEAKIFLRSVIQQYPDATHHCWAYRIGVGKKETDQFSDAGEPANSAGPPILQAIRSENITNTMVIVVRYFGNRKLGIGKLIKAYRETALEVLQAAGKVSKFPLREFTLEDIQYPSLGALLQSIESREGRIIDIQYGKKVKIKASIDEA